MTKMKYTLLILLLLIMPSSSMGNILPKDYVWTSPSKNSSESMPCGGGSIGLNVWVENEDIYFYVCRSGCFDENNTLLKLGRFRLRLFPALDSHQFVQRLKLSEGHIEICDGDKIVRLWCDVFHPVVHINVISHKKTMIEVSYESWRTSDRPIGQEESFQTSYKFGVPEGTSTRKDHVEHNDHSITFYHHNTDSTIFDATVCQQQLTAVRHQLDNPLGNLTFGGRLQSKELKYKGEYDGVYDNTSFHGWTFTNIAKSCHHNIQIALATHQGTISDWKKKLSATESHINASQDFRASRKWWNEFWSRSFITGDGESEEYTRNYTLFRYMLGCNAMGDWPTKFNGGLFCFDPSYVDSSYQFTPDYRRWGGGTHTAQNQRLVYWPMLKSGDHDLMKPQLDFYRYIRRNAEYRSLVYWQHTGACFTEQIENFGLPEYDEYGKQHPNILDPGVQYNAWLEYTWDTVLEFCQMALDREDYFGADASAYIPFIRSSLDFFDLHYRYLAHKRGIKDTDDKGKLIIYPGSGAETFKMAYNPTSTCCGLRAVTTHLIEWMQRHHTEENTIKKYQDFLHSIPDNTYKVINGHKVISPAVVWTRINGTEATQLYPVFPWREYGVGKDSIDIALNTWKYDPFVKQHEGYESWEQSNIWAACLGQTADAVKWLRKKLGNGPYRFPAFWGPGHDWTPDHNWGGSGMIGLQEMLLQEANGRIILFPAWPENWNVHFKLHAKGNTTVEAELHDGKIAKLLVTPKQRSADIVSSFKQSIHHN